MTKNPLPFRIDVGSERLDRDDRLLLCSDGLWGPLTPRQLLHALFNHQPESPADLMPEVPDALSDLVGRGFEEMEAPQ